jgi:hypothetical protein
MWRLGERAADVHASVVVRARDAGAAAGLDVHDCRHVQLGRARAVARLPDGEELREAAAVAGQQRRLDGVERVRQRTRDLALVEVLRARVDVAAVALEPLVVVSVDAPAEDVNRLPLAREPRGQLLRHEEIGQRGQLERPADRVVIGDRDEVHAAPLGQLVDLVGRGCALRQVESALYAELRELRRG